MSKGYLILTEDISDQAGMDAYGQASAPSIIASGAKVLAVDTQPAILEGDWHGSRTVMLEFESVAAAHAWYESEAYQHAKPLRLAAAECNAVLISGWDGP
jgi:uncharacterized protein (DUF1330 family)